MIGVEFKTLFPKGVESDGAHMSCSTDDVKDTKVVSDNKYAATAGIGPTGTEAVLVPVDVGMIVLTITAGCSCCATSNTALEIASNVSTKSYEEKGAIPVPGVGADKTIGEGSKASGAKSLDGSMSVVEAATPGIGAVLCIESPNEANVLDGA